MIEKQNSVSLKDVRINIKIEKDIREKFDKYCKAQGTTMSDELRRYIFKCLMNN